MGVSSKKSLGSSISQWQKASRNKKKKGEHFGNKVCENVALKGVRSAHKPVVSLCTISCSLSCSLSRTLFPQQNHHFSSRTSDDDILRMENATETNSTSNVTTTIPEFEFNHRLLFNVIAYSIMFVFGTIGNTVVSIAAHRQHKSIENNGRTNVHMMVLHLTISDLIVSYVVIPLEIGWRISVQWYAGNVACKFLMFVRAFAFYLSSMTLVCLSLDRYLAIAQPLASLKKRAGGGDLTKRRGRAMLIAAWFAAAVFALPQTLVFRVLEHPQKADFLQCTSMHFFDNVLVNNKTSLLTPIVAERIYNSLFLVAVYMVPLLVIIVTYANILSKLFRKSRQDHQNMILQRGAMEDPPPLMRWRSSLRSNRSAAAVSVWQSGSTRTELVPDDDSMFRIRSQGSKDLPSPPETACSLGGPGPRGFNFHNRCEFLSLRKKPLVKGDSQSPTSAATSPANTSMRRNRSMVTVPRSSANVVALRMSAIHVLAFLACWTPYLVISLWHIIDEDSVEKVNPTVQDALFLTAVFNSCINPVVYGGFYFRALTKKTIQRSRNSKTLHISPRYAGGGSSHMEASVSSYQRPNSVLYASLRKKGRFVPHSRSIEVPSQGCQVSKQPQPELKPQKDIHTRFLARSCLKKTGSCPS